MAAQTLLVLEETAWKTPSPAPCPPLFAPPTPCLTNYSRVVF